MRNERMTFDDVRAEFWESLPDEHRQQRRSKKSQNDYNATIRTAWVNFVDSMARDGRITESQASRITL